MNYDSFKRFVKSIHLTRRQCFVYQNQLNVFSACSFNHNRNKMGLNGRMYQSCTAYYCCV